MVWVDMAIFLFLEGDDGSGGVDSKDATNGSGTNGQGTAFFAKNLFRPPKIAAWPQWKSWLAWAGRPRLGMAAIFSAITWITPSSFCRRPVMTSAGSRLMTTRAFSNSAGRTMALARPV